MLIRIFLAIDPSPSVKFSCLLFDRISEFICFEIQFSMSAASIALAIIV